MPRYTCIICKDSVEYQPPTPAIYPFCSDRCKMIDLGNWFNEKYSLEETPGLMPGADNEDPTRPSSEL